MATTIKLPEELYLNTGDSHPEHKVIWKGASPSMFKSKGMVPEDRCTLVPNEINNLTFVNAFASMGRNIDYVLQGYFGDVKYSIVISFDDFKKLISDCTVVNGEFQGIFKLFFDGQVYHIIKVDSESYNKLLANIKSVGKSIQNDKIDKAIERTRKRKYAKENIKEFSRGDLVLIDGNIKAIFLGDHYCGYAKYIKESVKYYSKKQYPFLVLKDNDSEYVFSKYKGQFIPEFDNIEKIGEEDIDQIFNIVSSQDSSKTAVISRNINQYCGLGLGFMDNSFASRGTIRRNIVNYCQLFAFAYSISDSKEESLSLFKINFEKFITEDMQKNIKYVNTII